MGSPRVSRWRPAVSRALMALADWAMLWSLRIGWRLSAEEIAEIRRADREFRPGGKW